MAQPSRVVTPVSGVARPALQTGWHAVGVSARGIGYDIGHVD
jgi:hypothetical protein